MQSKPISISNEYLDVKIDLYGGALNSVICKDNGEQLLWQGDPAAWDRRDLVLFPFIGRQKDGFYLYGGKSYPVSLHGFAKDMFFSADVVEPNKAVLRLENSAETEKSYPFRFSLTLTYALKGNTLSLTYEVLNTDDKTVYFMIGGHLGLALKGEDGDTKGNRVIFSRPADNFYPLCKDFLLPREECKPAKEFNADKAFFRKFNTFITNCGAEGANITVIKKSGKTLEFSADAPVIAFWSHPDAGDFFCAEPWWGLPDFYDPKRELKDKEMVNALTPGGRFACGYALTVK